MTQEKIEKKTKFEAQKPDYSSQGVAVWINYSDKGEYLTIKLLGHNTIIAFKNKEKK